MFESDPFQDIMLARNIRRDDVCTVEDIEFAIRHTDCIKYHSEFISFVRKYWDCVISDVNAIFSVIIVCVAIADIKKVDLSKIIEDLAVKYEYEIIHNSTRDIDINNAFNFMRCFIDYGRSIKLCVLAVSLKILSLSNIDDISDAWIVLVNHKDVLEQIYGDSEILEYGHVLDRVIDEVFANFSQER